ncbi:Thioredoxin [Drechslerella dactyloides]|uniref:Thioredoxin n=1 Tax=Drechslerella dactyloides TaxID=74499 RepID=A0AAD6NPD4_DREDA|nr:Thioredoxin [Drechslerella dactyloides]
MDEKVASFLDTRTDKAKKDADSDDEDALLEELEREQDDDIDGLRERRLQQLHEELSRERDMRSQNQGVYFETTTEKEVMDLTTSRKYSLVHFFHPDFRRCKIMDSHLETLARKHFDTMITKINVENAPFLVEKLKVQVLPCLIAWVDGKSVDRIVGFEGELGNSDSFQTAALENRLLRCGVFQRAKTTENTKNRSIFGETATKRADDEDDDWD